MDSRSIALLEFPQVRERLADQLDELYAAGLRHFILGVQPSDFDERAVRRMVQWRDGLEPA